MVYSVTRKNNTITIVSEIILNTIQLGILFSHKMSKSLLFIHKYSIYKSHKNLQKKKNVLPNYEYKYVNKYKRFMFENQCSQIFKLKTLHRTKGQPFLIVKRIPLKEAF